MMKKKDTGINWQAPQKTDSDNVTNLIYYLTGTSFSFAYVGLLIIIYNL